MKKIENLFKEGLSSLGIKINPGQLNAFLIYLEELKKWNKQFNLTSIVQDEDIIFKHFIDSLTCFCCFSSFLPQKTEKDVGLINNTDLWKTCRVLDIGSGAGFPGLPLKICVPEIKLTLLESSRKKTLFLKHICEKLQLKDVLILYNRAEICAKDLQYREKYEIVVSRAVGKLSFLVEYCLPFVKVNGIIIAQKGPAIEKELNEAEKAINLLGGKVKEIKKIALKFEEIELKRNLVVIEKVFPTPGKYPRKPGIPSKRPIK
ncbi:16S rRNA (guanine(527)-N(7))-methyltransferase RsmG [bacterium]|nr:16S rRNA (guanine(527)-N(7))-methyltransferase RsmG [bacterium]